MFGGLFSILYSLVFMTNAVIILNDERFLRKLGIDLGARHGRHGEGEAKRKAVELMRAIRTVMAIPLIAANVVFIVYEVFLG